MVRTKSAFTILDDVLYLDLDEDTEEPTPRRLSHCIRELEPAIGRACDDFGVRTATAALIAAAVNLAADRGDSAGVADALRQNADMLDAEARIGAFGGTA